MINPRMYARAEALIAADCMASYLKANTTRAGKRRKKHRPYAVPQRAADLVKALGQNDGEAVAAILMYRCREGASEPS